LVNEFAHPKGGSKNWRFVSWIFRVIADNHDANKHERGLYQVVFWIVLVPEYIPAAEEEGA